MSRRRRIIRRDDGITVKRIVQFPSIEALTAAALGPSEMADATRASRRSESGFAGATWEVAAQQAVAGDVAGGKRLAPAIIKAANSIVTKGSRFDPVYSLDGGRSIDVARYVHGEPECWLDMVENNAAPRHSVAVTINVAASCKVSASAIDKTGIAVGGAVLGLQALGYAVTVYAAECNEPSGGNYNNRMLFLAPLNPGGSVLDISKLSLILRPYFLRRIMFSLKENLPQADREMFGYLSGGGYGYPVNVLASEIEEVTGNERAIVIDVQMYLRNPESIAASITNAIEGATNG
jgi:hypothetical protein